ncbi:4a-hydroxytetrahydrobiopterin dehydratase [Citricoccus sp. SGAir0253]|uniref:4a-hydroxytetrahydrobiopterin dehydratase n=1 Tax=Citricoccus sp. SGAir0253 TaxID=2567881 RepID=UPI0010CCEA5B|nr:4a-hydroxytetrahydrobiopterin dehydratase [Citricoccus sp. SGAir0253]QCU77709.1 4a-hydroxytetrahydrobiopterin dehydratase [Citricoccus sp. SGAir0253]
MTGILTGADLDDALAGLPDWRHRNTGIYTAYRCRDSAAAVELMGRIGAVCEELDHHPDLDWRYDHLFLDSSSHDAGGAVTRRDVRLARRISELAAESGAVPVPAENRSYDLALDTRDPEALEGFWATALGYARHGRTGDLRDPHRRGPGLWFQRTGTPDARPMHVDVTVPWDGLDALRTELAGRSRDGREDDAFAPRWWIYTDADGNRVCLCSGEPDEDAEDAEDAGDGDDPAA